MEVSQDKNYLQQVISENGAIDNYYTASVAIAAKENIIIPRRRSMGNDYIWNFSGNNWRKVIEAPTAEYSAVFAKYNQHKAAVIEALNEPWADDLFVVPDNGFIYYRKDNDGVYEFALAAWGYKYPDVPQGGKLEAPVEQKVVKPEPKPEIKTPE